MNNAGCSTASIVLTEEAANSQGRTNRAPDQSDDQWRHASQLAGAISEPSFGITPPSLSSSCPGLRLLPATQRNTHAEAHCLNWDLLSSSSQLKVCCMAISLH